MCATWGSGRGRGGAGHTAALRLDRGESSAQAATDRLAPSSPAGGILPQAVWEAGHGVEPAPVDGEGTHAVEGRGFPIDGAGGRPGGARRCCMKPLAGEVVWPALLLTLCSQWLQPPDGAR